MCLVLENLDLVKARQTESTRLSATVSRVHFRLEVVPTSFIWLQGLLQVPQKGAWRDLHGPANRDVVQDLGVNEQWLGRSLLSRFLSSQRNQKSRARGPSLCQLGAFCVGHPLGNLLCTVPPAGLIVTWRQLPGACAQSPWTEVETILSHLSSLT